MVAEVYPTQNVIMLKQNFFKVSGNGLCLKIIVQYQISSYLTDISHVF